MRTNIEIDDGLMAAAMEAGSFKTKKEAVEEGLRLVARRKVYQGLLALRGKLQWDDSDEAWARETAEADDAKAVQESQADYALGGGLKPARTAKPVKPKAATKGKAPTRSRSKST